MIDGGDADVAELVKKSRHKAQTALARATEVVAHMSEHIRLLREREWIVVEVDDTELFDFVEDFLTEEAEVEFESVAPTDPKAGTWNRIYVLGGDETYSKLEAALARLDPEEVERIYRVNNPSRQGAT